MREGAMDDDVVYPLAVAFYGKNLGIEYQPPEEGMHCLLLIFGNLIPEMYGIGVRHSDLEVCAARESKDYGCAGSTRF